MSIYRLYFRDPEGHFNGVREIEARDEAQAIGRAGRMCPGESRELWWNSDLLKRWDAGDRLAD